MQPVLQAEARRQFSSSTTTTVFPGVCGMTVCSARSNGLSPGTLEEYVKLHPDQRESFDAIVSTLVLCSVDSVAANIGFAHALLKPGGALVVLEHVRCREGSLGARIQALITPAWRLFSGSCNLDHDTDCQIAKSGLFDASLSVSSSAILPIASGVVTKRK